MTDLYLTIDTEYSARLYAQGEGACRKVNFARSIAGEAGKQAAGIFHQMDELDRHGLKAVFFVDPMPALVWGVEALTDVVQPILMRGHDVQLHLHTEWLAHAGPANPLGERTGGNMKDFSKDEQERLLACALTLFEEAGVPRPVAFRAGNYGANDNTLRALAAHGLAYDTSHCPGIADGDCAIGLGPEDRLPVRHCGVIEVPVGSIAASRGGQRHAQITALSAEELIAAIIHARDRGQENFTIVSHSFELLCRSRLRINRVLRCRFRLFCKRLAALSGVRTATYADSPPHAASAGATASLLPHDRLREARRMIAQAASNMLYGAR